MKKLSHKQIVALIKGVGEQRTVIVSGGMGWGKTTIQHDFAHDPHFARHIVPAPIECTQLSDGSLSIPDIDRERGVSRELPNERFGVHAQNQQGVNGSKPVVLCFDEVGKIPRRIAEMIAAPLYERRFGIYKMPAGSITYGCTNLSEEALGDNIPKHVQNRVVLVEMRNPTYQEWKEDFAIPRNLSAEVIVAADLYPQVFDSFTDYSKGGKYEGKSLQKDNAYIYNPKDDGQEQFVTGRSLHAASDILLAAKNAASPFDDETLFAALEGAVGAAFAQHITAMVHFGRDIPSYKRVVADPAGCPLTKNPTAQIIQVTQFVTQTQTRDEVDAVVEYVCRMRAEMQGLFVNTISNSSMLPRYVNNKAFGVMLRANREMFA